MQAVADLEISFKRSKPKRAIGFLEQTKNFHVGFRGWTRGFYVNFGSRARIFIIVLEEDQGLAGVSAPT